MNRHQVNIPKGKLDYSALAHISVKIPSDFFLKVAIARASDIYEKFRVHAHQAIVVDVALLYIRAGCARELYHKHLDPEGVGRTHFHAVSASNRLYYGTAEIERSAVRVTIRHYGCVTGERGEVRT